MATTDPTNFKAPKIGRWRLDTACWLHKLAEQRMAEERDLKIIITAEDSETGVGKTTCAGWLAITWTRMFAGQEWSAEKHATLSPKEYFQLLRDVKPGTVIVVDDAEELDARRSMQNLNVKFSQRWMLMRLKQAITILTLPSPSSIDSRLEELADVWINITTRGVGMVHDIQVNSYGNRRVVTKKIERLRFPDVSSHPELQQLRGMKEDKMDRWDMQEEDPPSPEEVEKETKKELAQRLRDGGMPIESQDPHTQDIAGTIDMSQSWVSKNTQPPGRE